MKYMLFAFCALFVSLPVASDAEETANNPLEPPAPAGHYVAGLGEIMAETQMRHAKLWFAGNAGNWGLADYELNEIKEGFETVTKFHPVFNNIPLATLLDSITGRPLNNVRSAIEARNTERFNKSFIELTAACNSCHSAANRKFIVITTPSESPVSNQQYTLDAPG